MKSRFHLLLLIFMFSCGQTQKSSDLLLWYSQPAEIWTEALPIGNGRLGAMIFGQTGTERIQLNEESLWSGSNINNNNPEALPNLDSVRQLILNNKIEQAVDLAKKTMLGTPPRIRSYQTLGDLYLDFGIRDIKGYKRELDLSSGICKVSYSANGYLFTQEVIASAPDNLIAIQLKTSEKGGLNLNIRLEREKDAITAGHDNQLIMAGQIIDQDDSLRGPGGDHMKFEVQLKAFNKGGSIEYNSNSLQVKNADELILLVTAATDYNIEKLNFDRSLDPSIICKNILQNVSGKSFKRIEKSHLTEYQSFFNRVSFSLTCEDGKEIPTDNRLRNVKDGHEDKELVVLYFQYGRYLLLGSSRFPGVLPANLQGIWNKEFNAPWNSDFHTNINLQMNYWPAEVCNLHETTIPLINFIKLLQDPGSITAREMYNARGWTLHHLTDVFGRTGVMDGIWGLFPMGGPWMTFPLFEHYEFNDDKQYLREKAYPILKSSAEFVLDFLTEDKYGRWAVIPSNSPENRYILPGTNERHYMTYSATMDIQIINELFKNCVKASGILDIDHDFADTLVSVMKKFPQVKISGKTGGIQEWVEDYDEADPGHRHMSHLLGLHPGTQITPNTPELFEAARKSIARRLEQGGGHTGWSRAWIINFYARLGDGNNAAFHLNELLRKSTLPNLFDDHPPFQIDGNFGGTAGIAEMLLQSHTGIIDILPALPDNWQEGSIRGLIARGGFKVDIFWKNAHMEKVVIRSLTGNPVKIKYKNKMLEFDTHAGRKYTFNSDLK